MIVPSGQTAAVPQQTDWLGVAKVGALIIAFLACVGDIIVGQADGAVVNLTWALGASLGVLQLANVGANVANVRAFLGKPESGVVPQAVGTPLVTLTTPTNGHSAGTA